LRGIPSLAGAHKVGTERPSGVFQVPQAIMHIKHPDRWHNGPGYTTCTDRFSGQITNVFAPPTVLDALLVNKQFHDIARSMFVGKNDFEFEGFYGLHRYTTECPTRLPGFCELTISFESPLSGMDDASVSMPP